MSIDGEHYGWRTIEFGPRSYGIERTKDRSLIGSIDHIDGRWQVEIQWPSRNDIIKDDFAEYIAAHAFVRGVAAAASRTGR